MKLPEEESYQPQDVVAFRNRKQLSDERNNDLTEAFKDIGYSDAEIKQSLGFIESLEANPARKKILLDFMEEGADFPGGHQELLKTIQAELASQKAQAEKEASKPKLKVWTADEQKRSKSPKNKPDSPDRNR